MIPFARYYQRVKNVIHATQALAIFIAWAITIAILTKGGKFDGRIWYYFALVSSFFGKTTESKRETHAAVVLVMHTCSHLSDSYPCFPTDTTLLQRLRSCCCRHCLYHSMARGLCQPHRMG